MPDLGTVLTGAISGAVCGSLSAAAIGWYIAPSRAEREERGKKRLEARRAISDAIRTLHYDLSEARQRAYRKEPSNAAELEGRAVDFATRVRSATAPLPGSEAWRVRSDVRALVGPGVWRVAELRPGDKTGPDSASLQAVADTRHWLANSDFTPELAYIEPTDQRWDKLLKRVARLQRRYPV